MSWPTSGWARASTPAGTRSIEPGEPAGSSRAATVVVAGAVALVATRGDDPERRDVRTVDTTPVPADDAVLQVVISNERSGDEVSEEGELLRWALLDPAGKVVAQGPVGDGSTGILPGAKVAVGRHRFVVESYPCVEFCPEQTPSGQPVPNQPGGIGGTADPAEQLCDEPVAVTTSGSRLVYEVTVTGDGCEGELHGRPAGGLVQQGWSRLPDPPLAPRFGSISASSGPEIFVIGGSKALCPPNADCAVPPGTSFADGAAYDMADRAAGGASPTRHGRWRTARRRCSTVTSTYSSPSAKAATAPTGPTCGC